MKLGYIHGYLLGYLRKTGAQEQMISNPWSPTFSLQPTLQAGMPNIPAPPSKLPTTPIPDLTSAKDAPKTTAAGAQLGTGESIAKAAQTMPLMLFGSGATGGLVGHWLGGRAKKGNRTTAAIIGAVVGAAIGGGAGAAIESLQRTSEAKTDAAFYNMLQNMSKRERAAITPPGAPSARLSNEDYRKLLELQSEVEQIGNK